MELNLPIFNQLAECKNLLIAGMGGGFDLFCGLPMYYELQRRGQNAHLANFSFTDISFLRDGIRLSSGLVGVTAGQHDLAPYFPELYLSQWFKEKRGQDVTIWCFEKTGARPLLKNYRILLEHLSIDGILLIDGGIDSLIRGDEEYTGTLIEDATSLFVVNELTQISTRLMACLGMGAERDISYPQILQNIATLTQAGGFLGTCSLAPQMEAYQAYEEAVLFVQSQPYQDPSVINSSVISAVQGNHGNFHLTAKTKGSHLSISPLMSIYWFFELSAVAERNMFYAYLRYSMTFRDALLSLSQIRTMLPKRQPSKNTLG